MTEDPADPAGFRRAQLEPELAAIFDEDATDEHPLIIVNTKQPHAAAINAVRTLLNRTLVGLPPALHWLTEPLRRITLDQTVAVACSVAIAAGSSLIPINPSTPDAGQLPFYVTNQDTHHLSPTPRNAPGPRAVPTSRTTQAVDEGRRSGAATPPPKTTSTPRPTAKPAQSSPPSGQPSPSSTPTLSATPTPAVPPSGQPHPSPAGGVKVDATVGPLHVELELPIDLDPVLGLLN